MTKRKLQNNLYSHTKSLLNNVLPLEYAIRAFRENAFSQYNQLVSINAEMHQHWLDNGFSSHEIKNELLLDLSWDYIQIGLPLSRIHGRITWNDSFRAEIDKTVSELRVKYERLLIDHHYPFVDRYRVIDLVSGNNIEVLAKKVITSRSKLSFYDKDDDIPLSEFVLGGVREAIKLYPGMLYQCGQFSILNKRKFGMGVLLDFEMSIQDIDEALLEFLYQYGKFRMWKSSDKASGDLINRFLLNQLISNDSNSEVKRLDSILSGVLGLLCYDQVLENKKAIKGSGKRKKPLEEAIAATASLFPAADKDSVKLDSIKKNYQQIKLRIKNEWNAITDQADAPRPSFNKV